MTPSLKTAQRGGFMIGMIVGLMIGLALALGVALYVTKAPNPFVTKVPPRTAVQDAAEVERNRNWDPNGPLAGRNPMPTPAPAPAGSAPPSAPNMAVAPPSTAASVAPTRTAKAAPGASGPAGRALSTGTGADPFTYFVQAGAYARPEDAEQQRAKLAMLGIESRLTEREQAGRTVFRVRVGPFERKEDADMAKEKLGEAGVDSALVRVQK